jgi:PLP dependent protein
VSGGADEIASNLGTVRDRLAEAAIDAGRDPADVRLIAVTKTVPAESIRHAIAAGATDLGENYVTELREKRPALDVPGVRWHYIGALQSSTAHRVADLADVVHTIAGERAVRRLAGRAARNGRTLDALIEVDFTGERAGVGPEDVPAAADRVAALEGIRLRGLMTIAPPTPDAEGARSWFRRLRDLRDALRERHPDVRDLSMGMSFGTAVFGTRTPPAGR